MTDKSSESYLINEITRRLLYLLCRYRVSKKIEFEMELQKKWNVFPLRRQEIF